MMRVTVLVLSIAAAGCQGPATRRPPPTLPKPEAAGQAPRIAVLQFVDTSHRGNGNLGGEAGESMVDALVQPGRFHVVTPVQMGGAMEEAALQAAGSDPVGIAARAVGARWLLEGTVTDLSMFMHGGNVVTEAGLRIRVTDVETGKLLLSVTGTGNEARPADGQGIPVVGYEQGLAHRAIRAAIAELMTPILHTLNP